MDRISHEAVRMSALVDDLLLLARLDQHRPLIAEPLDLGAVVTDSAADLLAAQPARPVSVATPSLPTIVIGDEARLRQATANLLANARAHTNPDVAVYVKLTVADETAVLTIADEGPGLAAADAAHAFDRFYRAEESRARASAGSGLGLAIVRSVIEAHHGTVTLETAPGAGATFTIRLPIAAHEGSQATDVQELEAT
jgi:two-component system, OmpR family, sensor kinase